MCFCSPELGARQQRDQADRKPCLFKDKGSEDLGKEGKISEIKNLFAVAELRYHNLVSFSESHVDEYRDIYFSDYNQDMKDIESVYRQIIKFTENLFVREPSLIEAKMHQIRAYYRLGVLYTGSGQYDDALRELEKVQELYESELPGTVEHLSCEYIDACIKKGKCYVEKRAEKEKIEECYYKAEKVLQRIISYQQLMEGKGRNCTISCFTGKEEGTFPDHDLVFRSCADLAIDLHLSWAICCVDIYDRLCMGTGTADGKEESVESEKNTALTQLKYHLSRCELIWQPSSAQPDMQKKAQDEALSLCGLVNSKIYIPFNQMSECKEREIKKVEQKIRDTYLSTRGLYHLKVYQFEENQSEEDQSCRRGELVLALHCFVNGFLCNTRNTIAMDNIAFIYLRYGKDVCIRADEKWRNDLPVNLKRSMLQDMRQHITYELSTCIQKEIIHSVKQIISNMSTYYDWISYSQTEVNSIGEGEILAKIVRQIREESDDFISNCVKTTAAMKEPENITNIQDRQSTDRGTAGRITEEAHNICVFAENKFHKKLKSCLKSYHYSGKKIFDIITDSIKCKAESWKPGNDTQEDAFQNLFLTHIKSAVSSVFIEAGNQIKEHLVIQFYQDLETIAACAYECGETEKEQLEKNPYELFLRLPVVPDSGAQIADTVIIDTVYPMIISFLYKTLEIEPSNMYALNLTVLANPPVNNRDGEADLSGEDSSEDQKGVSKKVPQKIPKKVLTEDVFNIYTSLRQSTLKKRFKRLDGIFYNEEPCVNEHIRNVKRSLIALYNEVSAFINSSIIDFKKEGVPSAIGHYTRLKVLPKIINQDNSAKLRLTNMAFVNDPREGKVLITILKKLWEKKCAGDTNGKEESVIDKVLTDYLSDSLKRSYVYIGCFTECTDELSMWDRYGDGGKGACLVVDAPQIFDNSQEVDLGYLYTEDDETQLVSMDGKYALHKVLYCTDYEWEEKGSPEDEKEKGELKKKIEPWPDKFKVVDLYMKKFNKYYVEDPQKSNGDRLVKWGRFENEVANIIMLILDQARYLVKSSYYRDEKEYRLIKYSSDPKCDNSGEGVPIVYIDMKRTMKYKEICLGPKVKDPVAIGAYILNMKRKSENGSVTGDTIVRKSSIPYQ